MNLWASCSPTCSPEGSRVLLAQEGLRAGMIARRTSPPSAFGYNTAAIPIAALGLLNPIVAGAAMDCSSVSVQANGRRDGGKEDVSCIPVEGAQEPVWRRCWPL